METILFIFSAPIDPNRGGVQRVTYTLAEEFEKQDKKVLFLSLKQGRKLVQQEQKDKRQLFFSRNELETSAKKEELKRILSINKITTVINQAGIYKDVMALMSTVTEHNIQLITVHHNCVSCVNRRYREIVLSNNAENSLFHLLDHPILWKVLKELNRRKYNFLYRNAIKKSDFLVLLSTGFIPELKYYGLKENFTNVIGIPNPAPFKIQEIDVNQKENRIIFVGRLIRNQKRVDRLMRIWKVLHEELPGWHFDVVGDGKDRKWMENYCSSNNMGRVHFHGYQDPRPFLRTSKIFTMTSDFEGFGMVLVEAQAFGVVPIAFNCFSSLKNIVTNNTSGKIIPAFNEKEYIKEVIELAQDEELMQQMSASAKNEVLKYDAKIVAQQWNKIIEQHARN